MSFKEIAKTDRIASGAMQGFEVDGRRILIANISGQFLAINGKCTHMGGDLTRGKLEGQIITCPRHGAQFDVTTGKNVSGPKIGFLKVNARDVQAFPLKVEGNIIMIDPG